MVEGNAGGSGLHPRRGAGVGRRRMGRRRGAEGKVTRLQCKKQGRQGFLVGLVRGCTTGFAAWAAAAHDQNHPPSW